MKQCSKCKETKSLDLFHNHPTSRDGKRPDCKACVRIRQLVNYDKKSQEFKSGQHRKNSCPQCNRPKTRRSTLCQECARPSINPENPRWRKNEEGYVVANIGTHELRQHRFVMEKKIGRKLLPEESVHHKNGVRDDNRLDNLELWSSSHPSGQRVEDKVRWAKEILALYNNAEMAGKMGGDPIPVF